MLQKEEEANELEEEDKEAYASEGKEDEEAGFDTVVVADTPSATVIATSAFVVAPNAFVVVAVFDPAVFVAATVWRRTGQALPTSWQNEGGRPMRHCWKNEVGRST